jgi:hypothetical protein
LRICDFSMSSSPICPPFFAIAVSPSGRLPGRDDAKRTRLLPLLIPPWAALDDCRCQRRSSRDRRRDQHLEHAEHAAEHVLVDSLLKERETTDIVASVRRPR